VTDWLPTLLGGLLGRKDLVPAVVDGKDQWAALMGAPVSDDEDGVPRDYVVYNADDCFSEFRGAVRVGSWKYILDINMSFWPVPSTDAPPQNNLDEIDDQADVVAGLCVDLLCCFYHCLPSAKTRVTRWAAV
jgi:hypothetical protein